MLRKLFLKRYNSNLLFREDKSAPHTGRGVAITVINQKGGCGKTTTVVNLASCLAELGKRVLIVDADPQGHATLGLGLQLKELDQSLYHVLINPDMQLASIIKDTYHPHLHLIPSNSLLASAQIDLINIIGREVLLREKLSNIRTQYDFVFIDCPPSLNLLTLNALTAASKVIIPVQTHFYSLHGMNELFKTIDIVKKRFNPNLDILGILPTLFDKRSKINYNILTALKSYFQDEMRVFESVINSSLSLVEAAIHGRPAINHRSKSRGARDYYSLAKEILALEEPENINGGPVDGWRERLIRQQG